MNIGEAIAGCGIVRSEARLLLGWATRLAPATLAAHPEREVDEPALVRFKAAVERRARGEPMAYLLGEREFYGLVLKVTPQVLIPRPETELLVDFAIETLPPGGSVLDLGTGSGAVALAIKQERPDAEVTAVERSETALELARENASRLRLDVAFVHGSWFSPVAGRRFDLVVSNPPYVAEGDPHLAQGDLRFEPRSALVGGEDGLEPIRAIAASARAHLVPGGRLAIEHGLGQEDAVRAVFESGGLESIASRHDLAGIARITIGKYNSD